MKTKTKPTHRARRMWANYCGDFIACHDTRRSAMRHDTRRSAMLHGDHRELFMAVPVAVIPLDDSEALVQLATEAYFNAWSSALATRKEAMRSALTAIGVLPKQRKGGAK